MFNDGLHWTKQKLTTQCYRANLVGEGEGGLTFLDQTRRAKFRRFNDIF